MMRRFLYIFLLFAVVTSLAACGKKGALELPPGEEDQTRTYPRGS